MATHSSILAWKIPWMEKPGRLQSMGSQSQIRLSDFTFTIYRRVMAMTLKILGLQAMIHIHFSTLALRTNEESNLQAFRFSSCKGTAICNLKKK